MDIIRALNGNLSLKGMDAVEVLPPSDHASGTAIAGAHMAVVLICLWARCR